MIAFPNAKINLGLNILRKRDDGYHDLETVFYPLPLYDALEIIAPGEKEMSYGDVQINTTGIPVDGPPENNLCVKAYQFIRNDYPIPAGIRIHLHKTIPVGAGLGGGSADGSFALVLLNKIFQLDLSESQLLSYAIRLGSDCPFFIINKPCFASGRGEQMAPVELDLRSYKFLLIHPGIHVRTAHAFAHTTPRLPARPITEIIHQPVTSWKDELKNDFEEATFQQFPEIKKIKDELYAAGAVYASMSGSGSSVYGIFDKDKKVSLSFPKHYWVKEV